MSRLFVKVCGITSPDDAAAAAEAGADAIGLVFWPPSPRAVTVEAARRIGEALPPLVARVGVFVDATRDEMARIADLVGLDLLQLHGSEPAAALADLPRRVIKALRVGDGFTPGDVQPWSERAAGILLDAAAPHAPGGAGRTFDWSLARGVRERVRFLLLAGGLGPENVRAAVEAVRPHGVDASSLLESSPGRKDVARVRAFVEAAREAAADAGRGQES